MQGDAAFSLLNTLLGPSARLRRARDERVSDLRHPRWLAPAALSIFGAAEPRADSIEKARMLSVGHALKFRIVKNALRAFFTIRNFRRRAPQARASVGAGIRHSLKTQHLYKNYACRHRNLTSVKHFMQILLYLPYKPFTRRRLMYYFFGKFQFRKFLVKRPFCLLTFSKVPVTIEKDSVVF